MSGLHSLISLNLTNPHLEIQRNQEILKVPMALVVQLTLGHQLVPVALVAPMGLSFLCLQLHLEILVGLVDQKVLVSLALPAVPEDLLDLLDLPVLDYLKTQNKVVVNLF